jgi:hypothetical protein
MTSLTRIDSDGIPAGTLTQKCEDSSMDETILCKNIMKPGQTCCVFPQVKAMCHSGDRTSEPQESDFADCEEACDPSGCFTETDKHYCVRDGPKWRNGTGCVARLMDGKIDQGCWSQCDILKTMGKCCTHDDVKIICKDTGFGKTVTKEMFDDPTCKGACEFADESNVALQVAVPSILFVTVITLLAI